MTFNLLLSFFDQMTLCNATRPNHPHQNKRKQRAIVDHTHMVAKTLSTHVYIVLTQVSVPAEEGSIIPSWAFHSIPVMSISHHPHHGHFTQCRIPKHKQPNNLVNNKRRHAQILIVLQKPQTTK
jgi:hypothetical protein